MATSSIDREITLTQEQYDKFLEDSKTQKPYIMGETTIPYATPEEVQEIVMRLRTKLMKRATPESILEMFNNNEK